MLKVKIYKKKPFQLKNKLEFYTAKSQFWLHNPQKNIIIKASMLLL